MVIIALGPSSFSRVIFCSSHVQPGMQKMYYKLSKRIESFAEWQKNPAGHRQHCDDSYACCNHWRVRGKKPGSLCAVIRLAGTQKGLQTNSIVHNYTSSFLTPFFQPAVLARECILYTIWKCNALTWFFGTIGLSCSNYSKMIILIQYK
jgi:hypothetical protein